MSVSCSKEQEVVKIRWRNVISASFFIGGTTIGAGMLGIPYYTAPSGFLPAFVITVFVWFFMYCTGVLFYEAMLWMKEGANVLSVTERFLGRKGKIFSGCVFIFLYYCLLVAYYSAGAPLLVNVFFSFLPFTLTGWMAYAFFSLFFAVIISIGLFFVDRLNYMLMIALCLSFIALVISGSEFVALPYLKSIHWNKMVFAAPLLFSAFGYHNIIPPLTFHYKDNPSEMRWAIFIGSLIPLVFYLAWQWLIIGSITPGIIHTTAIEGRVITQVLETMTGYLWLSKLAKAFGFFAIMTSMLGVSYSIYDFINDGVKITHPHIKKIVLCLLTFIPPFIMTAINPHVFIDALSIAGGFGEAFLNGILPIFLVWIGRYIYKLKTPYLLPGGKKVLVSLIIFGFFVVFLEVYILLLK